MSVPEAAVYETCRAMLREHHVRAAWHACLVDPVPESAFMKPASDEHFGLGVLPPDPAHHQPALVRRQYIRGGSFHRGSVDSIMLQRPAPPQAVHAWLSGGRLRLRLSSVETAASVARPPMIGSHS